jgi:signal peptidase I
VNKIFKTIYHVLLGAIVLIAVLLIISTFPITGNFKTLMVLSGSMEPAIRTGSVVVIKPEAQYKIGDVVTFGKDTITQVPTTHRIVSSRAVEGVLLFTTKGDANNAPDVTEIRQSDIHGKVLFSVPYFGYLVNFVRKPAGIIIIIVIPALFIIYDEAKKIAREVKKMRMKKKEENNIEKNV